LRAAPPQIRTHTKLYKKTKQNKKKTGSSGADNKSLRLILGVDEVNFNYYHL